MSSAAVAERLGYRFGDPALLEQALTHRSFTASHNERLEFLGDGVLNCVIAIELYRRFPDLPEGDLSRLRAHLVNQSALAGIAERLGVGPALRLGEGEMRSGGARRPSILADAFEAILGAVFLDGGFAAVHGLVVDLYASLLEGADPAVLGKDAKTQLQELLQGRRVALPVYEVVAVRGQAHDQTFEVECRIPALEIRTTGTGRSRRAAEQEAAARACALAGGR